MSVDRSTRGCSNGIERTREPREAPAANAPCAEQEKKPSACSPFAKSEFIPASSPKPAAAQRTTALAPTQGLASSSASVPASSFGERVAGAIESLFSGITSAVSGAARNLAEAVGTFVGGIGSILRGDVGKGLGQLGMSLVKVFQTPVDAMLMGLGHGVSAIQTVLGLEPVGSRLTPEDIQRLKPVFGNSVDYSRVVIKEGDVGLMGLLSGGRGFVVGDTIYLPKGSYGLPGTLDSRENVLTHEMVHVWHHQNGGTDYASEALFAQFLGKGYDWVDDLARMPWSDLNPEQQARAIQYANHHGFFGKPNSPLLYQGDDPVVGSMSRVGFDYQPRLFVARGLLHSGRGAS